MKSDPVLAELIGYQLKRAAVVADADAREALAPFGLTPAKMTALVLVRANPGCDQTALGRALDVNRSSAMKLVNALSGLGLVERRPGRDARTNALFLLPAGEERLLSMLDALRAADARLAERLNGGGPSLLAALARITRPAPRRRAAAG